MASLARPWRAPVVGASLLAVSCLVPAASSAQVRADETSANVSAPALPAVDDAVLAGAALGAWRAHLQPAAEELRWQEIPWRPTFADGLRAADAAGKPLLLWLMNGHPLGCT